MSWNGGYIINVDTNSSAGISSEASTRYSVDTTLLNKISADVINLSSEVSTRLSIDTWESADISGETSSRESSDTALSLNYSTQISSEASSRYSSDVVLSNGYSTSISSEVSCRESSDLVLSSSISTEVSTLNSTDLALSTAINQRALYMNDTGTFPSAMTSCEVSNDFITANTWINVMPTEAKEGDWNVVASSGAFVITSTSTESSTVDFAWIGIKGGA